MCKLAAASLGQGRREMVKEGGLPPAHTGLSSSLLPRAAGRPALPPASHRGRSHKSAQSLRRNFQSLRSSPGSLAGSPCPRGPGRRKLRQGRSAGEADAVAPDGSPQPLGQGHKWKFSENRIGLGNKRHPQVGGVGVGRFWCVYCLWGFFCFGGGDFTRRQKGGGKGRNRQQNVWVLRNCLVLCVDSLSISAKGTDPSCTERPVFYYTR